jgi:hypothetical protein
MMMIDVIAALSSINTTQSHVFLYFNALVSISSVRMTFEAFYLVDG